MESNSTRTSQNKLSTRIAFPDLDIMKFVMALLVVAMHTQPLESIFGDALAVNAIESLERVAVPFFFIASGFLCFFSSETNSAFNSQDRLKRTIVKMIKMYLFWTIIYLPVTILGDFLRGLSPGMALLDFLRGAFLVGENFCSWPLWYLLASIVGFFLILVLTKLKMRFGIVFILSLGFLLAGYCLSYAHNLNGGEGSPVFQALIDG